MDKGFALKTLLFNHFTFPSIIVSFELERSLFSSKILSSFSSSQNSLRLSQLFLTNVLFSLPHYTFWCFLFDNDSHWVPRTFFVFPFAILTLSFLTCLNSLKFKFCEGKILSYSSLLPEPSIEILLAQ